MGDVLGARYKQASGDCLFPRLLDVGKVKSHVSGDSHQRQGNIRIWGVFEDARLIRGIPHFEM